MRDEAVGRAAGAATIVVAAVAAHIVVNVWPAATSGNLVGVLDTYTYFYPGIRYALRALAAGGEGLFWNPLQNCGQPAFANPQFNFLYPPFAVFAVADLERGVAFLVGLHLAVAGLGMLWLCRVLGLGWLAALSGAAAFTASGAVQVMLSWQPTVFAPYLLLPLLAAVVERGLQAGRWRWGVLLGVLLGLQLLAGYPQITAFTYQLILLRLSWQMLVVGRSGLRGVAVVGAGLALAPLLVAVKLLPGVAFARASIRGKGLDEIDLLTPFFNASLADVRAQVSQLMSGFVPFRPAVLALMALGLIVPSVRRGAAFYWLALVVFIALAFDNPIYRAYLTLPLATHFRAPARFLWMASFCACVLAAYGVEAMRLLPPGGGRRTAAVVAAPLAACLALYALSTAGLTVIDLGVAACVILAAVAAVLVPRARTALLAVIPLALYGVVWLLAAWLRVAGAAAPPAEPRGGLERYASALAALGARMTAQERMYQFSSTGNWSLAPKVATLFDVPSALDYEPETSVRYADLLMALRRGRSGEYSFAKFEVVPLMPNNPALLNLVAAHYIVTDRDGPFPPRFGTTELPPLLVGAAPRVFENPAALPRAFFVPRAEVVGDPGRLLDRLMQPLHDPRLVALIEAPPADGFLGAPPGDGPPARVQFLDDRAEHLRLAVEATQPGFLFIADQDYPGWQATVNGAPVPILRANYAFRLVRVPSGHSTVELTYRPAVIAVGGAVSLLTVAGLVLAAALRLRRPSR